MESQHFHQHHRGQNRPHHGAEHIGEVEIAEAVGVVRFLLPHVSHHKGKSRAHENAPRQNRDRQNQRREKQILDGIRLPGRQQALFSLRKQPWHGERSQPNDQLRPAIKENRRNSGAPHQARNHPATGPGSDREPEHEHRNHHREHRSNNPKRSESQSRPNHLVNQTAKS